ncbi:MAG: DegQ family serine endoprotease [Bryobacteraceae bacterium]|nr:DegQ family serine endoprotease [Bryobacteraceae bacterium]
MNRNLLLTGVLAALIGAGVTQFTRQPAAPVYVQAQDKTGIGLTFAPLVKKALPAVVNVESIVRPTAAQRGNSQRRRLPQGVPPGMEEFFGFGGAPEQQQPRGGVGSGVIVTSDGYILTNNHVVEGATTVKVSTNDRREFTAKVVGTDPRTDVAVLKIEGTNLPVLPISDSTRVQVGDLALAIGDPFGIGQTVTMGIISATGRAGLTAGNYEDFIQTDAAINPGNSGGALINTNGELIGINTAIISRTGGNQGIGFAIPINMARDVMDQLVKSGKVTRGYIGVLPQDITPDLARAFNLKANSGAAIARVEPDTPASKAGLKEGDVVTAINGEPVTDANGLRLRVSRSQPGTTLKLTVQRADGQKEIPVTLERLPEQAAAGEKDEDEGPGRFGRGATSTLQGLNVTELTADIASELQLSRGTRGVLVARVDPASSAGEAGLRRGDVITSVNRQPVTTVAEFEKAVGGSGSKSVLLLVNRGGGQQFVVVEPQK